MPCPVRANNKATKIFSKIMGTPAPLDKDYYKKKDRNGKPQWEQTLPGSASPNGIGPIF